MEADISILLKPGHFYFALTRATRHVPPDTCHQTRPPDTPPDTATRACPSKINIFPASTLGVYCWRYAEHMEGPWVCPVTNADGRLPN